jgi:hypothetical protein
MLNSPKDEATGLWDGCDEAENITWRELNAFMLAE